MRSNRDPKRKPTHPGEVLREDVLPALEMTQTEFAKRLNVSRLTGDIECGPQTRALLAKIIEELAQRVIEQEGTEENRPGR